MTSKLHSQLVEFHIEFKQPIVMYPSVPPDNRVRLRAKLIAEEFFETMAAMFDLESTENDYVNHEGDAFHDASADIMAAITTASIRVDMPELADGLADLDYVIEGTRLEFGIDGEPVGAEVHRANLLKAGGPKDPVTGKQLKPPGWTPPDIEGVLRKQGWKP